MAIIDKNLGAEKASASRSTADDEVVAPSPVTRKAAPRATLNLSDWDNIKRVGEDGDQERGVIPPHLIPDGFSVEWKRIEVLGKPDNKNISKVEAAGWRPAPADVFREILPSGYSLPHVEDGDGRRLYIRPAKFTQEALDEGYRTATQKVKDYENSTMNRVTAHKDVPSKVHAFSRSYEKVMVPD
jgi:hypothetical protein